MIFKTLIGDDWPSPIRVTQDSTYKYINDMKPEDMYNAPELKRKLLISTCQMVILKTKFTFKILPICVVNIKTLIKEMPV